ncbi:MAG: family 2 glycosyl transferase [Candidatus Gottesmanbacteria bacterium GW2011_GWA2_43_14]|uniref:Family 2 glycosyl transferase n=1 Tax=Candidatus Gottesmanbacteria bacterium GW2011_GWA2_43_14 TaxID=1618443 RepID=A0A0G1DM57_9BACT|nr:MAG: family 2 glycosyl transferase [Candidatus Gottesmanbacteria bacterium GW2011_GWA2_43_14]
MAGRNLKISLVTPSFNQGQFIEQTIKSVLGQKYPNLEYIVMDGGSKDGTTHLLKKYTRQIDWTSGKDKGQSDALNRGFRKSTGEIIGFINSDDYLLPGSLKKVSDFFHRYPRALWVTGKCRIVDLNNREVRKAITAYKNMLLKHFRLIQTLEIINFISQPATFWRRDIFKSVGLLDTDLHYSMDYDYWLRIWQKYPLYFLDDYLACYRVHPSSKTVKSPENQFEEEYMLAKKHSNSIIIHCLHKWHATIAKLIYRKLLIK